MSGIRDDGGAAFPCQQGECSDGTWNQTYDPGMTLRDFFAAKALQAYLSHPQNIAGVVRAGQKRDMSPQDFVAIAAYEYADAMLKARQV